jgi:hypothetical protein
MEKYFVFMKNAKGKEVVGASWKLQAIDEFISFHQNLGYVVTKRG